MPKHKKEDFSWFKASFACFSIFVLFSIIQFIVLIYCLLNHGFSFNEIMSSQKILEENQLYFVSQVSIISSVSGIFLILLFSKCLYKNTRLALPIHKERFIDIGIWIMIFYLLFLCIQFLTTLLGIDITASNFTKEVLVYSSSLPLLFYAIGIAQPIFEEFLFRGLLFKGLENKIGGIKTVFITSFLFVLPHIQYDITILLLILFPSALILGFCRLKTNSLTIPIIIHCINNTVSLIIALNS